MASDTILSDDVVVSLILEVAEAYSLGCIHVYTFESSIKGTRRLRSVSSRVLSAACDY